MATDTSFRTQVKNKEADWKGMPRRYFRWSRLRFEWGRLCEIVHPVEGCRDFSWIEWEADQSQKNVTKN